MRRRRRALNRLASAAAADQATGDYPSLAAAAEAKCTRCKFVGLLALPRRLLNLGALRTGDSTVLSQIFLLAAERSRVPEGCWYILDHIPV